MGSIDRLIGQARARARKPDSPLPAPPRLQTVILTCMDARIDPVSLFGLSPGDAHVLRNAGALASSDVLRSLAISQAILGTREILVLGHTECGLLGRSESELAEAIRFKSGHKPGMEMGAFKDLDHAVAGTVDVIRGCKFLAHRGAVHGYVYDIDPGSVRPVGAHEDRAAGAKASNPLSLGALSADVLNLKPSRRPQR
jgi:carbonic anhydrase